MTQQEYIITESLLKRLQELGTTEYGDTEAEDICNSVRNYPNNDTLDELAAYAEKIDNYLLQNCVRICKEYQEHPRTASTGDDER